MHAADAYEVALRTRGLVTVTIDRARRHLDVLLGLDSNGSRLLSWLTPRRASQMYERLRTKQAVDTHRNALGAGKSFGRFCAKQGWLTADPFANVDAIGRRKRGKPQLTIDEARKLVDMCLVEASRQSAAVATAFMLGMSASEVTNRQVRDLDDGGRVLVVTKGKNAYRSRSLEVPDDLRELLVRLAAKRPSAAHLFGDGDLDRPTRYWLHYHCKRLCALAKVPAVTPQGLRGTHSTIAVGAVSTSHSVRAALVAAGGSLGHAPGSPITATTYVAPGAVDTARQRVAMRVLQGGAGKPKPKSDFQGSS